MTPHRHDFANRHALAESLALKVAESLSGAITRKGRAVLAVSGGTTPSLFLEQLSRQPISWEKVTITLVDERQVDETSERSNARLVKARLLANAAAAARFVPLFRNEAEAQTLAPDVVVLGMGEDGHTASFFPGGDTLSQALDLANQQGVLAISAPGAGEPRLTFTLSRLLQASRIFLHTEGQAKQRVLAAATAGSNASEMPIRAVLAQAPQLQIYWCP